MIEKMDVLKSDEIMTCHQLSCLVITSFICNYRDDNSPPVFTPMTSKKNLILLLLEIIQHIDMEWSGLMKIFGSYFTNSGEASKILHDKLLALHKDNCCELYEFIRSLDRLSICRKSLLGVFVRKVALCYKKMTFAQLGCFAKALASYLQQAKASCIHVEDEKMQHVDDELMDDTDIEKKTIQGKEFLVDTVTHANQFISQQVALISSQNSAALPPYCLQKKIMEIIQKFPDNFNAHFLAYLNYSRVREVIKSIDELHQYFDRKKWREDDNMPNTDGPNERTPAESLQARFKRFRYCALNLGILHFYQDNFQEAIASLEEAVKMAQETSDQDCLEHAMFWLLTLKAYGKENDASQTVAHEISGFNKREFLLPQLQGLDILQRCKLQAFKGTREPASIMHDLQKAEIACPKLVSKMYVTKTALLDTFGLSAVAIATAQIPLFHGSDSGLSPIFKFCGGLNGYDPESHCLALCQLAKFHADEGLYNEAESILKYGEGHIARDHDLQKWMTICRAQIEFDRAVLKRNIEQASSSAEIISVYDKQDAEYRRCVIAFLDNDILLASKKVSELMKQLEFGSDCSQQGRCNPMDVIRLKYLVAEIHMASDDVPGALTYLLEGLSLARKYQIQGFESQALLMIAQCKIHLGMAAQAIDLVQRAMIQILSHGSLYLRSCAFLNFVKCRFILLQNETAADQKSGLLCIIPYLEKCCANFRKLSCISRLSETLCLQSHVFHMVEYTSERNRLAKEFVSVKAQNSRNSPFTLFI